MYNILILFFIFSLICFYEVAKENKYVRPEIRSDDFISIEGCRHPLMDSSNFVPNDAFASNTVGYLKLIFGPTNSGKSTFIKQIAMLIFMTHIGSYVPAKAASIGIFSHILTRIINCESTSLDSSNFLQDIRQVKKLSTFYDWLTE